MSLYYLWLYKHFTTIFKYIYGDVIQYTDTLLDGYTDSLR